MFRLRTEDRRTYRATFVNSLPIANRPGKAMAWNFVIQATIPSLFHALRPQAGAL
jgi:hypothetical protein